MTADDRAAASCADQSVRNSGPEAVTQDSGHKEHNTLVKVEVSSFKSIPSPNRVTKLSSLASCLLSLLRKHI